MADGGPNTGIQRSFKKEDTRLSTDDQRLHQIGAAKLPECFHAARRDPTLTVLEGLHPLKHALRFGGAVDLVVTRSAEHGGDLDHDSDLWKTLAPDVAGDIKKQAISVSDEVWRQLAPVPPPSGVIAIAKRRVISATELLSRPRKAPIVVLERPSHLGNIGASIRVAASVGAAGVITTGRQDPWHPTAVRGAAGLHYATSVAQTETFPPISTGNGPLIGLDPEGAMLAPHSIPADAVLVFGSESRGLTRETLARLDKRIAIPMQPGVSSLNLATAIAVVLYAWKLWGDPDLTRNAQQK